MHCRHPQSAALRHLLWALLIGTPAAARAADAPADPADNLGGMRWVAGTVLTNGPIYYGQSQRSTGPHLMYALRWGWLRISNAGAGGLLGESAAGGATADVFTNPSWKVRLGARVDGGRRIEDDAEGRLVDLPTVRRTLRGRVLITHALPGEASLSLSLAPDLLGRQGGTLLQLSYYKRLPTPDWLTGLGGQWSVGAYLNAGDDRYMHSYFGVPPGARLYPAYEAEGGLRDTSMGLGWQRAFGERERWVLFAGASAQRLLGPAAKAPFVQRVNTWNASLGLAYRHQ